MIPRALYDLCDSRLRDKWAAVERAEQRLQTARERAYAVSAAPLDQAGSHGGGKGDKLERAALAVTEAEEQLRQALAWMDVFDRLERIYPPETQEGTVARLIYDRGMTQADCCRVMHRERKRIRELKDTYVINCALLAVQAGLARMEEG